MDGKNELQRHQKKESLAICVPSYRRLPSLCVTLFQAHSSKGKLLTSNTDIIYAQSFDFQIETVNVGPNSILYYLCFVSSEEFQKTVRRWTRAPLSWASEATRGANTNYYLSIRLTENQPSDTDCPFNLMFRPLNVYFYVC